MTPRKSNDPTDLYGKILSLADKLRDTQISWRRHLHQHPELSMQEHKTTVFIKDLVTKFGLKTLPIHLDTGVLAELRGKGPGKTVAVRTDIDALPIIEQTNLRFKSKHERTMHACGHDVHMATVLGVASVLSKLKDQFDGTVRFLFQPSEELPPGGARPLIASGALEKVSMILGLHVDPDLPTGKISLRDGPTMASVTDFELTIHGLGGHAARPHDAIDAIVIASEVVQSIQAVVSREIDPMQPVAITFGKINGGTATNVICDRVELCGTARALFPDSAKKLPRLIKRTAESVSKAHGGKAIMKIVADYPVLSNHPSANQILARNYERLFGKNKIEITPQVLGGEDFACYLEKTKGAMFRLGIRNKKMGADKSWHSPKFIADENAIYFGTSLLAAAVIDTLQGAS